MASIKIEEKKSPIQTFVFIDLETTGLGADARLLELTMLAVSRIDLVSMSSYRIGNINLANNSPITSCILPSAPTLPRVVHKYTRLYYPKKLIMPSVEQIHGLNNEMLHSLPSFSKESALAIELFLSLPSPVCLVAHNGCKYDYPVLKSELVNVDCSEALDKVYFVDSLKALREFGSQVVDNLEDFNHAEKILGSAEKMSNMTLLAEDFYESAPLGKQMEIDLEHEEIAKMTELAAGFEDGDLLFCIQEVASNEFSSQSSVLQRQIMPHCTPAKVALNVLQPSTPKRCKTSLPSPLTPETGSGICLSSHQQFSSDNSVQSISCKIGTRRRLSYGVGIQKNVSYRQSAIYRRLFGEDYVMHHSESDCQALLQICGYYGNRFTNWADEFADTFDKVKPLFSTKRKSFQL